MPQLSMKDIEPLLHQFKGDGLMVSCYADLSGPDRARWIKLFKTEAGKVKELFRDDHRAWQECEEDLEEVRSAVQAAEREGVRSIAVFSARRRGFFHNYPLDVPVESHLVVHQAPYLVPLLEALCRQRSYLVVQTDTHHGRLFAAREGEIQLLHEVEEAVPRKQHSSGQRWGKEQATIARHRDDRILHYHKGLAELIGKCFSEHPFRGLVLLGEHEILEHLRKRLPARLAGHVVHEGPQEWTTEPETIASHVETIVMELASEEETRVLERVDALIREGRAVAVSPPEVVDAIQSGRVGPRSHGYLVIGHDPRETVARCTACRTLFTEMPSICPRCQAPCESASLWEEVLLMALRHDIVVHCVKADGPLRPFGSMAAALSASAAENAG
jgi:hypothetical protein